MRPLFHFLAGPNRFRHAVLCLNLLSDVDHPYSKSKTGTAVGRIPSDSQMRDILDPIDPDALSDSFQQIFSKVQQEKGLDQLAFLGGHYLLSGDGTGFFYSNKLSNDRCLEKYSKKTGETTYYQQFYGAAIVHPDFREVIPLPPEFIVKQDGATKNDCEREASKRFLAKFRKAHPQLPVIMIEDGLSSNGPHIRELQKHNIRFILGVKENDHTYLFEKVDEGEFAGRSTKLVIKDPKKPGVRHCFHFINGVPLNKTNKDLLVNFLEYEEVTAKGKKKYFSWVTDFELSPDNVMDIMRGGRARWKIENETFNTLKNQGYHLEHSFGLGDKNLSQVFVTLMMLAFLVDQTQQLCCGLFRAAWQRSGTKRDLWETRRTLFKLIHLDSFTELHRIIAEGGLHHLPGPLDSS